jgi:putative flippase GtrA
LHHLQRIAVYAGVNTLCLPCNIGLAWILTTHGLHYILATIAGFMLHVLLAFSLNRTFTFRSSVSARNGLAKSAIVAITGVFVAVAVTALCVEVVGLSFLASRILAMFVAGLWDYVLDSQFTFREQPPP